MAKASTSSSTRSPARSSAGISPRHKSRAASSMSAGSAGVAPPPGTRANTNFALHPPRRIHYTAVTFRTRTIDEIRDIFDEVRKDIWGAVESRKLQLPIDKVYKFDEIGTAFERME